jgi:hypothetical protein
MWESRQSRPPQGLAEKTQTDDELAKGWRYRQPFLFWAGRLVESNADQADTLHGVDERIVGVREINLVIDFFHSGFVRCAIFEFEIANARLDLIRGDDLCEQRGNSLL